MIIFCLSLRYKYIQLANYSENKTQMQELQAIFWQRNSDITLLKQQQKQMKKQEFQERQKQRMQRQNWIMKIIKTIKVLTAENKKNIYESVTRMMSYYTKAITPMDDIDFQKNFTEELINLFIVFYNQCAYGDMNILKKVIRPNNTFIVFDLVKQLVETHRQFFKVKLMQNYKEVPKITEQKSKARLLPLIQIKRSLIPATQPSQPEEIKKQTFDTIDIHYKIKLATFQKWQNFINYGMGTEQNLKNKMNDTYLQLLERNSFNNFMINKFQEKCYGKSRAFNYNISGLYTQQQIRNMENKLQYDVKQKFSSIKQLKGDPSADQLKQYFKIKTQIQDNYDKIQSKKLNNVPINSWVPVVVQKSGFQHQPLNMYIVFAKELVLAQEFQIKCGITLKNYMRMILKNKIDEAKQQNNNSVQLKNFKRHQFLDINHNKKRQLMVDQHRLYEKSKKQSIFPMLRSNQLRQQTQIAIKNRSLSEYKLTPIFKNEVLSRKLQLFQNSTQQDNPSMQFMKSQQQQKTNLITQRRASQQKQKWNELKQSVKGASRSKIDTIIDKIINQRNLTLTN